MFTKGSNNELMQIQDPGTVPALEGGDSLNWTGYYNYLGGENGPQMSFFQANLFAYVRHPDPAQTYYGFGAYYKNPWDGVISRDQMIGLLCGLIAENNRLAIIRIWLHGLAWLGLFTYNTRINGQPPETAPWKFPDLLGPSIWQMFIRGVLRKKSWIAYPLLLVCDTHLLLETLITNKTTNDLVISYLGLMFVAMENKPTFVAKIAWRLLDKKRIEEGLKAYWSGWRQNPGMVDLFMNKIKIIG